MKKLLLLIASLPGLVIAQPAPPVEATTNQVAAGTLGYPFVLTPRNLAGSGLGSPTNGQTALQVHTISDTTSNALLVTLFNATTNIVVITNGTPPVVGQMLVITGTNTAGEWFVKGTNIPAGGGSTIPSVLGLVTNTAGGVVGVGTAVPGTWIAAASIPRTAADSTWASATNYPASTNTAVGTLNQVPLSTGGTNTFGSPTFNWGNLPITALSTSVHTNAFTNNIVGYINLTNDNGFVFQMLVGTNLP